ncbi:hypothetical protein B0H63DRAFT_390514 [Podospora didyma]|uniref:Rhodopsin domain-containing protein n=1 Tax=Podospora didyma TaxID=330526 RepID=A0AAE0NXX8_9PEZI|nr:hypothetical protein B0H63DRAFT_390514 [Podospora didyma]
MRLPPAEVRMSWPKPNYIDPETRGPGLLIVELTILPAALICVILRLYVRLCVLKKSGIDDWLMVIAVIFAIGVTVCVILANTTFGWATHIWDLRSENMVTGRQISLAAQALFVFSTTFAKVSILFSYLRLAPINSWFRDLTRISIGVIIVGNVAFIIVLFTQCIPTSSYWNLLLNHRDCIAEGPPLLAQAALTVTADFVVWILPLPTLYQAQLPLRQRIALIVLFSFGLVVVVAAIVRTYWIHYVVDETFDVTWAGFHLWIWTAVEVNLGVICGCVPWLKSLFKYYKTGGSSGATASKGTPMPSPGYPQQSSGRGAMLTIGSSSRKPLSSKEIDDTYLELDSNCGSSTTNINQTKNRVSGSTPV